MAPTHVSPLVTKGIVLVKQVVLTLIVDQSVGIVHPVFFRGEVVGGTVKLSVSGVGNIGFDRITGPTKINRKDGQSKQVYGGFQFGLSQ